MTRISGEHGATFAAPGKLGFIRADAKAATDRPDHGKVITVGKHSRETLTHEEEAHERLLREAKRHPVASGRRPSAAEREMLYHTLTSHRIKLFAQASEMTVRLGDLLAEVQRLDRQLADMERSAFWRTGAD